MKFFLVMMSLVGSLFAYGQKTIDTDVLIVGGGASGTAAAIQAARAGVKVVVTEETTWLGGMITAAGVSCTDGNHQLPSGIWGEFRERLYAHYGSPEAVHTGWVSYTLFEPSVGNKIWKQMVAEHPSIKVLYNTKLLTLHKNGKLWNAVVKGDSQTNITAKVVIDGTELGDVAKLCGVKYDIGMDARSLTGEPQAFEKGNNYIQDMTVVAILKDYGQGADKTIPKPKGYNEKEYACTCREVCDDFSNPRITEMNSCKDMMTYGKLPNGKYMINWPSQGNDYYVNSIEMTDKERKVAYDKARLFTLGYVYFLQTKLGLKNLGLADDEFPTADKLALIPYHRESRRIHGLVQFRFQDIKTPYDLPEKYYRTGIAVGNYPCDHHRIKCCPNPPKLKGTDSIPAFSIPAGVIIPKDVEGLLVTEKSISVTNIVNGSTRLQPVVIELGQAAGALAALAVKEAKSPKDIDIRAWQSILLQSKAFVMPYLDVKRESPFWESVQRIGATGIIKGIPEAYQWENRMWFKPDTTVTKAEFSAGIDDFTPGIVSSTNEKTLLTVGDAVKDVWLLYSKMIQPVDESFFTGEVSREWQKLFGSYDVEKPITRLQLAVLLDKSINPFTLKQVDFKGNFINH
jgi:2-polyprenyl-6-methoxyphenol hydroxylase and related FAD-dependent oxidoreductases